MHRTSWRTSKILINSLPQCNCNFFRTFQSNVCNGKAHETKTLTRVTRDCDVFSLYFSIGFMSLSAKSSRSLPCSIYLRATHRLRRCVGATVYMQTNRKLYRVTVLFYTCVLVLAAISSLKR